MIAKPKTLALSFVRSIPASPTAVYSAWLNPKNPGSPWYDAERVDYKPKQGGMWYFMHRSDDGQELPHFGRFVSLEKGKRIHKTWMSRHTQGLESTLTLTFEKEGSGTRLTLRHEGLPDNNLGKAHKIGWEHFLGVFEDAYAKKKA